MSFPGIRQNIKRSSQIRVRALDKEGRPFELDTEGQLSTALQHEIDHLDGVLIIDRVSFLNKRLIHNQMVKLAKIQSGAVGLPE